MRITITFFVLGLGLGIKGAAHIDLVFLVNFCVRAGADKEPCWLQ